MDNDFQTTKPEDVFTVEQIAAIKCLIQKEGGIKLGVLHLPTVKALTGFGNTKIWDLSRDDPDFPKPIKLSKQCTVWRADELYKWLDARTSRSDRKTAIKKSRPARINE